MNIQQNRKKSKLDSLFNSDDTRIWFWHKENKFYSFSSKKLKTFHSTKKLGWKQILFLSSLMSVNIISN